MANRWGNNGNSDRLFFLGLQHTADNDCSHEIKMLAPWKKSYDKPKQHIEKQRYHSASKGLYSQRFAFPVVMHGRELNHKEGWALKNWYFWNVVLERTLESPVDCKEIKPVNSKWNQPWIFTGRTDVKGEAPTVWPPDVKSHSLEKTLILGKIEGKRRRGLRGWDGWMASSTQWIWVWTNSAR